MSNENKRWRCAYCGQYKSSKFKPVSSNCPRRKNPKTGERGLHRWERVG